MDILCLGELLIDMFPAEIGRSMTEVSAFHPKPGGAPANVAVAAARLGARSGFIGKVGEDIFGRFLESVLIHEGVDTQGMRFDTQARTTLVFIAMPDVHSAEFVFYRNPGADMLLRPDELPVASLQLTRCLHFGSLSLIDEPIRGATLRAIEIARAAGALISFDVNYRPALWSNQEAARQRVLETLPLVDLVKVNQTELKLLTSFEQMEQGSFELLSHGPRLCVVTLGAEGSFFQSGKHNAFIPGFAVETVDATGCGDAFVAGMLTQLVRSSHPIDELPADDLGKALRYANAVGALTALAQGVIPALPHAGQVAEFLQKH
ncbi:MAG: carbohydrate kinase [Chloroflexota bacterium]|nr:MAG: carbohydrate kinase [Chloroflexota bacterium]